MTSACGCRERYLLPKGTKGRGTSVQIDKSGISVGKIAALRRQRAGKSCRFSQNFNSLVPVNERIDHLSRGRGESISKVHLLKPVLRPGGLDLPTLADFEGVIQM